MQDNTSSKPFKNLYEFDVDLLLNKMFMQHCNNVYETEFRKSLNDELNKKVQDFERKIKKLAIDELSERNKSFTEWIMICNNLYHNTLIQQDTRITDIYLEKNWIKSDYFNAIVCVKFVQYQKTKIEELEQIKAQESKINTTFKLSATDTAVLLYLLKDYKVFNPEAIHKSRIEQVKFIALLFGIEFKGEIKNSAIYKSWSDVMNNNNLIEYLTFERLKNMEKFIQLFENRKLVEEFERQKAKANSIKEKNKIKYGL